MTDYETIDVDVKFKGVVSVQVPKNAIEKSWMAKMMALDRVEAIVNDSPVSDESFMSWCESIDMRLSEEECEDKYSDIWNNAKVSHIDGTWEWK